MYVPSKFLRYCFRIPCARAIARASAYGAKLQSTYVRVVLVDESRMNTESTNEKTCICTFAGKRAENSQTLQADIEPRSATTLGVISPPSLTPRPIAKEISCTMTNYARSGAGEPLACPSSAYLYKGNDKKP